MKESIIICSVVIVSIAFIIGLASINTDKKSDYINVGGQSEVVISPDFVVLYFSITTNEQTPELTQELNAKAVEEVRGSLIQEGVKQGNIETSYYYLNKKEDWTPEGPIEKGYELVYTLKVTTDVHNISRLIKSAVNSGANSVDRIEFITSKDATNKAVAEAMAKATMAAKQKAETVTKSTGVKLGRTLKIEESGWWIAPSNEPSAETAEIPSEYANNLISPQKMAVQANVNVAYAVG